MSSTFAPAPLKAARLFIIESFHISDPNAVGIVGDLTHRKNGSSYHLGEPQLRDDSYSIVESSRDRKGLSDAASALDIGQFSLVRGGRTHTLRTFSAWLVAECRAGATDTLDIREVIYSLDGKTVHRWDRLGRRTTGDSSHLLHTHISYYRDSENRDKTALFRRYLTEIEGDDVSQEDVIKALESAAGQRALFQAVMQTDAIQAYDANGVALPATKTPGENTTSAMTALGFAARLDRTATPKLNALTVAVQSIGDAVAEMATDAGISTDTLKARLDALAAQVDQVDEETAARLKGKTPQETADLLRALLGADAAEVGRLLAT